MAIRSHGAMATWRGRDHRQRFRLRHFGFNPIIAVSPCRISRQLDSRVRVAGAWIFCGQIGAPVHGVGQQFAKLGLGRRPNAAAHREPALKRPIRRPDRPAPFGPLACALAACGHCIPEVAPMRAQLEIACATVAPEDGEKLLDELLATINHYVVFASQHQPVAVALWTAATYGISVWQHATRLVVDTRAANGFQFRCQIVAHHPIVEVTPSACSRKQSGLVALST